MKKETQCIHEGYKSANGEPLALPIYQSTTYTYDNAEYIGKLFDLTAEGHMYSRISNPTVACVEQKISALEGGVGALCVSTGQAALLVTLMNIMSCGDHLVASSKIYGGSVNLLAATIKRFGIECTLIDPDSDEEEIQRAFRPNTRALFGESLANPALSVLDIEKFAKIAHRNKVPLIVDNTFPTPILCRPFEHGADIVTHSTTKYMDGHAIQLGGAIVDSGNFDWAANGYTCLSEPDETYHGLSYTEAFGKNAFITKARVQLVRDLGVYQTATGAFYLDLGLQTLAVRIEKHCANARKAAEYLQSNPEVEFVNYPGLKNDRYHKLAEKYLPDGCSGVISFSIKGDRERALKFMRSLKLAKNVVHVATVHTCVLHPASSTHRQLTDEQLVAAGVTPGLIRLSVGIENIEDILDDLKAGFKAICE